MKKCENRFSVNSDLDTQTEGSVAFKKKAHTGKPAPRTRRSVVSVRRLKVVKPCDAVVDEGDDQLALNDHSYRSFVVELLKAVTTLIFC